MIVIGIDPGIATIGYGVIHKQGNKQILLAHGAILTPAHTPLSKRLLSIHQQLSQLIALHQPTAMAVEELFFNTNVSTGMIVAQARGVILLTAEQHNIAVTGYTPQDVKMAVCGYGRADKKQVQDMVKRLLNLETRPKPDDVADAIAIAICHCQCARIKSL